MEVVGEGGQGGLAGVQLGLPADLPALQGEVGLGRLQLGLALGAGAVRLSAVDNRAADQTPVVRREWVRRECNGLGIMKRHRHSAFWLKLHARNFAFFKFI